MKVRSISAHLTSALLGLATTSLSYAQCEPRWVPDVSPGGIGGEFLATVAAAAFFDPDGEGPLGPELLIGGTFLRAGGSSADLMAIWDGASWKKVPDSILRQTWRLTHLQTTRSGRVIGIGAFHGLDDSWRTPVAVFANNQWLPIDPNLRCFVRSICESRDGTIYALGYSDYPGDYRSQQIARVDRSGSTFIPCATDDAIKFIAGDPGGEIVAGGRFRTIEGVPANGLARWDGTRWSSFDAIQQCPDRLDFRHAANLPNGDLIVGGSVGCLSDTNAQALVRWDGTTWTNMGDIFCPWLDAITTASDGSVYALGGFVVGQDGGNIARWDGELWSIIASDVYTFDTNVLAGRDRSCVFAGGSFRALDDIPANGAALWEHNRWSCMGGDDAYTVQGLWTVQGFGAVASGELFRPFGNWSNELAVWSSQGWRMLGIPSPAPAYTNLLAGDSDGHLIAVIGGPSTPEGGSILRRWSGSDWISIGSGLTGGISSILTLPDQQFVVTGYLGVNGDPCRVAYWNGRSWSRVGSIHSGEVNAVARMNDGTLVIGGSMTINDGDPPAILATWDGDRWASIGYPEFAGEVKVLRLLGNGLLVVGGTFYQTDPSLSGNTVFVWDGHSLQDFNAGLNVFQVDPWLSDIQLDIDGTPLLIGNLGSDQVGPYGINRWNGHSWEPVGGSDPLSHFYQYDSYVVSLGVHSNGDLLICGKSLTATATMGARSSLCYSRTPSPRMAQSPLDLTIAAGDQIVLSAAVIMNLDEVSYQWYRNGVAINPGSGGASESGGFVSNARGTIAGRTDDSRYNLTISNCTTSDAGDYTIAFTNPCGTTVSRAAVVSVRCFGDFNLDGGIDGSDIADFFPAWQAGSAATDVDFDGLVDVADITMFLRLWSEGSC